MWCNAVYLPSKDKEETPDTFKMGDQLFCFEETLGITPNSSKDNHGSRQPPTCYPKCSLNILFQDPPQCPKQYAGEEKPNRHNPQDLYPIPAVLEIDTPRFR